MLVLGGWAMLAWLCAGCFSTPKALNTSASVGYPNHGVLWGAQQLPDRGHGYVKARPGDAGAWGTPRLVRAIERAAGEVIAEFGAGEPLRVGDLSYRFGGEHPRHGSHRTGRDVDLIYYAMDGHGVPVRGRGWVAYNRFGFGVERARAPREHGDVERARAAKQVRVLRAASDTRKAINPAVYWLDVARTWHLIRTFLTDPSIRVQWIFCSWGIKRQLLLHAAAVERNSEVISRARWVLHRPSKAVPHDDHLHIRIACSEDERALGCVDGPPHWPWLERDPDVRSVLARESLDDSRVVAELMEE